jgi:adenylate cyclase
MTEHRRLAAILVADVVGYSKLVGSNETGTLVQLQALRSEIIDAQTAKYAGRLFKSVGDGFLIEFSSAVQAVSCARAIQEANARGTLPLRIGIHLGDVVVQGDDLMGDGVNIAARIEGVADAGGIAISRAVHEQVRDKLNVGFTDKGEVTLKNLARPVHIFAIASSSSGAAITPGQPLALPDKPSIAVLPFQNMSGDPEQEYFVDGLAEDIITALSRFSSLFVIARNSSFAYKGKSPDIRLVGRELGVRYVLEGSVRKVGARVRITGQLIEAASGAHLWADRFDGELADVFALQDRITEAVTGTIAPSIERAEVDRARRSAPKNIDAYDLHLQALAQYYEMTEESFARSEKLLDQALQLDPNLVPALVAGLRAVSMRSAQGWTSQSDVKQKSLDYSERALRLEKDDAEVLANTARLRSFFFGANEESLDLARRATEINPNSASAWMHRGWVHVYAGRPQGAVGFFERAIRLSPRDLRNFETLGGLAGALVQLGRYDEAVATARRGVQQGPNFSAGLRFLVAALALAGRKEETREAVAALLRVEPKFSLSTFLARNGRHGKAYAPFAEGLRLAGLPE